MRIYFALDEKCITEQKIKKDILGGTERFMMLWIRDLQSKNHTVCFPPFNLVNGTYDLCIHSNVLDNRIDANKHILWVGSWHASGYEMADITIVNSQYMKDRLGWNEAVVIPACVDDDVFELGRINLMEERPNRVLGRIICHSNPWRYLSGAIKIAEILKKKEDLLYHWIMTGGNKLYSDQFSDQEFTCPDLSLVHIGPIPRKDLLFFLSSSAVWAYPNFTDESETLCVAALEAAAMGLPVLLPQRQPFISTLSNAMFCEDENEMAERIVHQLKNRGNILVVYGGVFEKYGKRVVMDQLYEVIQNICR